MARRSDLLLQVSRMFFDGEQSKTEISRALKVSVTQVSRLLREARAEGIVTIQYHAPLQERLAAELKTAYPCLQDVVVVGTESEYVLQTRTLAETAARYFDANVGSAKRVGLSGGLTVFEMVKCLPDRKRDAHLFPTAILGRGNTIVNHIDPIVSLTLLWAKSGYPEGRLSFVTITPPEKKNGISLSRADIRLELDRLLERDKVKLLFSDMHNLDFVFASLRQLNEDAGQRRRMGAPAIELLGDVGIDEAELLREGVVGDLNYSFVDADGTTRPDWKLFLSLQIDDLARMAADTNKRVVVIAGSRKERILRAALAGRLLNVLITDEETAEGLV